MVNARRFCGSRMILYAVAVALGVKLAVDALPDAAVAFGFMRPAARLAAIYLGAAFDIPTMTISARGVTIAVVRACSATDFFSMAFTLLCFAMPIRHLALRIQIPAVHMAIGIAVFLPVFALLWYTFVVKASCKRCFRQNLQD